MTLRIDQNRPYGEIHPPLDGAFFEQDGKMFDQDGVLLSKAGADKGAAKSAPSSSKEAKTTKSTTEAAPTDLAAWVRGEVKAPFFTVKKAALAQFPDIDTTNAGTLKAGLIANGVGKAEAE